MPHISIISASVRINRASHRVALYFKNYLEQNKLASVTILDLIEYQFPLFDERLMHQPDPSPQVLLFADEIKKSDGVIMVTPEYNGGYPASLKNVIDLLYTEWQKKPIAITTVSDGQFGGSQVITSLLFTLWKIKAWVVAAQFPVPKVKELLNEEGIPTDKASLDKRAKTYINELIWCIEAKQRMDQS